MLRKVLATGAVLLFSTSGAMAQMGPGAQAAVRACKPDIAQFCIPSWRTGATLRRTKEIIREPEPFNPGLSLKDAIGHQGSDGSPFADDARAVRGGRCDRHGALLTLTVLSDKAFLFVADLDGELRQLMLNLAKLAGPLFDTIFGHVDKPPPTPVADNAEA